MKIGIISDIHSNLEALESVIEELKLLDKVICLGDIVGYGPDPEECINIIKDIADVVIAGNHDWGVCGKTDIKNFNNFAKEAIIWTANKLDKIYMNYLSSLPLIHREDGYIYSHSNFSNPEGWDYIIFREDALREFFYFEEKIGFIGHSHIPITFIKYKGEIIDSNSKTIDVKIDARFIINPGSIGQPRDGYKESSYLILDTEENSAIIKRKDYDVRKTYRKIVERGLPKILGDRLFYGK